MPACPASNAPSPSAVAAGVGALIALGCASGPSDGEPVNPAGPALNPSNCAASEGALGQVGAALSVVDRSMIGSPAGYPADGSLRARESSLHRSMLARREVAWSIASRVLAPVPLPGELGTANATLPTWQTWHNKDDLTRIFRRLYPELSPDERASRAPLAPAAVDAAWLWNDGAVADFDEWTGERLTAYRDALDTPATLAGTGGVYRVAYSPEASRHVLESYGPLLACRASDERVEAVPPLPTRSRPNPCAEPSFVPACLMSQFPSSAVLVKATWQRLDAGEPLLAFDTSAESLGQKLDADGAFTWGPGDRPAEPRDGEMYTLELPNGNRFGLTGLHIMTKELEHWVWVTLWWSDRAGEDFGADRPLGFPAPFAHYKLCSVVSFVESDADPEGGFTDAAPSLARALAVTHRGAGGPTWCSNPYIERGDGNVATNCIGCHQHGGTRLRSEDILADRQAFPDFGRTEQRPGFPSDYVFSVRQGDDVGAMFVETEDHYAAP
jgi:hypothetical protein